MSRDPIEPARTLITVSAIVVGTSAAMVVLSAVSGRPWGPLSEPVCVDVPHLGDATGLPRQEPVRLPSGAQVTTGETRLCADQPTGAQRALDAAGEHAGHVVLLALLLLAVGLFRLIRVNGLFTTRAVARLRMIGWVVIVGTAVADLFAAFATTWLAETMTLRDLGAHWYGYWHPSGTAVVLGTVLVSVARVLRLSTAMREDLEGTV